MIPIILRPCDWNHSYVPFSKLNVLPDHAEPITGWADQDAAFTIVARRIRETVNELTNRKQAERQAEEQQRQQQIAQKEADRRAERERIEQEQLEEEERESQLLAQKEAKQKAEQRAEQERIQREKLQGGERRHLIQQVIGKDLQECDPARILFIKNVKAPTGWAYLIDQTQQPENKTFELMWRLGSHGVNQPKAEDLMILHQRAKVTHIVEFLDDQVRETDTGFFRWVRAIWLPEQDWNQLPHQKEILRFSPRYADGNTHALNSLGFTTFHKAWNSLEAFQKHIIKRLAQLDQTVSTNEPVSEKGINYTQLEKLLMAGQWQAADQETSDRMCEVMGRQQEHWFRDEDLQNFPCTDLRTIDQLWVKYSKNQFGFSIQEKIWQDCYSLDRKIFSWESWCETVGWKKKGKGLVSDWLSYSELTFDLSAPQGHLPCSVYFVLAGLGGAGTIQELEGDEISSLSRRLVDFSR